MVVIMKIRTNWREMTKVEFETKDMKEAMKKIEDAVKSGCMLVEIYVWGE